MPEANVLYAVTAVVVLGLATWVAFVLKTAKEPWARELPKPARAEDVPLETAAENAMTSEGGPARDADAPSQGSAPPPSSSLPKVVAGSATGGADATADATAVVIEKKADANAEVDAKADAKADADADAKADAKADDAKAKADVKGDDAKADA